MANSVPIGSNNLLGGALSVLNSSMGHRDKSRETLFMVSGVESQADTINQAGAGSIKGKHFAPMPQQPAAQASPGQPLKDSHSVHKMQKKPSAVKIKPNSVLVSSKSPTGHAANTISSPNIQALKQQNYFNLQQSTSGSL